MWTTVQSDSVIETEEPPVLAQVAGLKRRYEEALAEAAQSSHLAKHSFQQLLGGAVEPRFRQLVCSNLARLSDGHERLQYLLEAASYDEPSSALLLRISLAAADCQDCWTTRWAAHLYRRAGGLASAIDALTIPPAVYPILDFTNLSEHSINSADSVALVLREAIRVAYEWTMPLNPTNEEVICVTVDNSGSPLLSQLPSQELSQDQISQEVAEEETRSRPARFRQQKRPPSRAESGLSARLEASLPFSNAAAL